MSIEYVPDIIESNGKTIRENNLAMPHKIPIGALVEVNIDYVDEHGLRLFVVHHSRDCDGTPLYDLSLDRKAQDEYEEAQRMLTAGVFEDQIHEGLTRAQYFQAQGKITRHFSEESLIVVRHATINIAVTD